MQLGDSLFQLANSKFSTEQTASENAGAKPLLVLDPAGHSSNVMRVLFTADSRQVITVSVDKSVRIWDLTTGETLHTYRLPMGADDEGALWAAALAPGGDLLAVSGHPYGNGNHGMLIHLLSLKTGRVEKVLKGHDDYVTALAFSADGKKLASGSHDKTVRLYDVSTGAVVKVARGLGAGVKDLALAPNGKHVAVALRDGKAGIWSLTTGQQEGTLQAEGYKVCSIAWSPDGQTVVTGHWEATMGVFQPNGQLRKVITGLRNQLFSVNFTPSSREVLFTGVGFDASDNGASLVELASGRERIRTRFHNNTVAHGSISPDGKLAVTTGGDDNETYVWETATGKLVQKLVGQGKTVWGVGWSPDGQSIAWGNANQHRVERSIGDIQHTFHLEDLDFDRPPDRDYHQARLINGSRSLGQGPNFRLEIREGDRILNIIKPPSPGERVYCYSWISGGRIVVGTGGHLYLYDPDSGRIIRQFRGHAGVILSVAPSPDGRHFLTGATDQTMRIWNPDREEPLLSLFVVERDWVAWTPEGYYAASPNGERLMGWQINQGYDNLASYHSVAQFHQSLYRPEVISRLVAAGSLRNAWNQAAARPSELMSVSQVLTPAVTITSPAGLGTVAVPQSKFEIRASAKSVGPHPVTSMRLMVDGRPFRGLAGLRTVTRPELGEVQASWTVELPPGIHHLSVLAESVVSRSLAPMVEVNVAGSASASLPNLYVLAIGVNDYPDKMKLRYAAPDADAIATAMRTQQGKVFRKVEVKVLTDQDATRAGILRGLEWLGSVMTAQDVGIFSFSGHGTRDPDGSFYLVPVDVDGADVAASCVPGETVKKALGNMPGRLIAIFDACHSGTAAEGPKRALTDDLVRDLIGDDYGVIVMSSSLGREYSLESAEVGHGFFTLALVEGMAGRADANNDGTVYLNELDSYAVRRVKELSAGRQNPVTARPAAIRSFPLARP